MKKQLLTFIMLAIIGLYESVNAQAPSWAWAKGAGGSDRDEAFSVTNDALGNLITVGYFQSPTIAFDTITLTNSPGGNSNIFIVKYNAIGNVIWAKSIGGTDDDFPTAVTTDASDNIIAVGFFYSPTITFDTITLNNAGDRDIFIVKYDSSGNILWARSAGGSSSESVNSVAADTSGNLIVAGGFGGSTITLGSITLTNAGGAYDMFLVKYDKTGVALWAKSAGGLNCFDEAISVATDVAGNIAVAGYFESPSITIGATTLANVGGRDLFVARYSPLGAALWAKSAGGSNTDNATSVTTDTSGNVIAAGFYWSSTIAFSTFTLTNSGGTDLFITKYDVSGNVIWALSEYGVGSEQVSAITTDPVGNIIAAGSFITSNLTFGQTTLSSIGSFDIFIVKFDGSGSALWAKSAGGTNEDYPYSIVEYGQDNVAIAGSFIFTSISLGNTTLSNAGFNDVFIAKLSSTTGIQENNSSTELNVYPNPFSLETNLQTKLPLKNATLTLSNVFGQTVRQIENITTQNIILHRDNLPCGVYFIQLKEAHKIIAAKRIIVSD